MDNKTVIGFILLGVVLAFSVICKKLGIDGDIQSFVDLGVSTGLFLLAGKDIADKKIEPPE